jgi:regulator of sigma E protease
MTILSAIVLLGILIFVHELGHFIVAKLMKVKVEKFSLGFGPKLIGKTIGETEYRISAVPLGGYVKMLGENPGEEQEEPLSEADRARAYNRQPVKKRFSIVLAGPLFNIVFAAFVFIVLFMTGVSLDYPDIGQVREGSPAEAAGLREGDRVLEVDGTEIVSFNHLLSVVHESPGSPLLFNVLREGDVLEIAVTPEKKPSLNIFGEETEGGDIGVSPLLFPVVGEVMEGTPAEGAALRKGDRIVAIDGVAIGKWQDMTEIIYASPEKPLDFEVKRGDETIELTITPERKTYPGTEREIGLIGIRPMANTYMKTFGLVESVSRGVQKTVEISWLTLVALVKLIQRVLPADTLGGPILIVQMAGQQASQGFMNFFNFMAVISINLGIINLFPIPVLDGGHLVFLGIEAVRRKPVSERTVILAQKVGLVAILLIMAFALYNDIVRVVTGKGLP